MCIIRVVDKVIGKNKIKLRKPWMTGQTLELIERRKKLRNRDYNLYKQVKNKVTTKCRLAKEGWLNQNI